jgi:hypothetical protein
MIGHSRGAFWVEPQFSLELLNGSKPQGKLRFDLGFARSRFSGYSPAISDLG